MMAGGGGGPSYFPSKPNQLQNLIRQTQESTEQKRMDSDVNQYLQDLLIKLNNRKTEKVQEYIDGIDRILKEEHEVERLLFGGSVAKHTFVDGLSDVDALVVLNKEHFQGKNPKEVLGVFLESLQGGLARDEVATLDKGNMAVTVTYRDGTEIQLLPALRNRKDVSIPS